MMTSVLLIIAFSMGFYFGVLIMSLLAISKKRDKAKDMVLDAAA